ncbi:MAG TPA: 16S rRNA (cytidine(1402)-2'-O)-methyltransferase [Candidatus Fraserbacteria bacterium]|nr:16S rRNA (cytidine(1402)-2'-O)-methyltransferase [Candidatus Fraserbacteria bacterium]
MTATGTLYLVATPIGNLEDITIRALNVLRQVDLIVAEDSRHSARLLQRYEISTPCTRSYYQGVERQRTAPLLAQLQAGKQIALICDAGTPLISDPGYPLVRSAVEAGIPVRPIPGPTALIAGLIASGLPSNAFIFDGVPPKKDKRRQEYFRSLLGERRTVVLYESPHRILQTLRAIAEILPERPLALCRELTKVHEELLRGRAREIREKLAVRPAIKGEFVLIIRGAEQPEASSEREELSITAQVQRLVEAGWDRRDALKEVARLCGLPKREVYDAVVAAKLIPKGKA